MKRPSGSFSVSKKWPSGHFFETCARSLVAALPAVPSRKETFPAESTKIAAQGHRPVYRPDGARRFSIGRLPTVNDCDGVLDFFDTLQRPSGRFFLWVGALRACLTALTSTKYEVNSLKSIDKTDFKPYHHWIPSERSGRREAAHDVYVSHDHVSACVHARAAPVGMMEAGAERACLCDTAVTCVRR